MYYRSKVIEIAAAYMMICTGKQQMRQTMASSNSSSQLDMVLAVEVL
jgi:hypothetical protein